MSGSAGRSPRADLQRSILELIHVLASQSIAASELAAFLRLFTCEAPPLALLLAALRRLADAAAPHTPDCILTFPVDDDTGTAFIYFARALVLAGCPLCNSVAFLIHSNNYNTY